MADKVLDILSSADREVALEAGLLYPLNALKHQWMDDVKVVIFGPSEKVAAYDTEIQNIIKEILAQNIEVMACKYCSDRMNVSELLEKQGIKVEYIGPVISQLIKDGWATLTF